MAEVKNEAGPIQRKGLFLWQEDSPTGAGMNLWSGLLSPNNGYPQEHAERAAMLFSASPALYEALKSARALLVHVGCWDDVVIREIDAALALAEGKKE